jgi:L-alanine-DL-glutamate epimerase-like enolase superfamily enzyme
MKITQVETWKAPVALETPYTIAYATVNKATLVFVRIETDTGILGYGCAGCDVEVTGETAETVFTALSDIAVPTLRGANPLLHTFVLGELKRLFGPQPSALAAVDMALYDILGKILDLPLWKVLGGFRDRIPTSVTIGILPEAETVACARRWIGQGFSCLKLKGGRDVESDVERVIRVREEVGEEVELRFDANQAYTVPQALKFARETQQARVAFLEQPTPKGEPALLGQVRRAGLLPVMADESLMGLEDAFFLAKHELVDLLNVKLMKAGGIAEALQIEAVARAAGLAIMVGCMDESALGIAAGLHFALARPGTAYADLDGHLGLCGDPAGQGLTLRQGILFPPEKPGLGVEPKGP